MATRDVFRRAWTHEHLPFLLFCRRVFCLSCSATVKGQSGEGPLETATTLQQSEMGMEKGRWRLHPLCSSQRWEWRRAAGDCNHSAKPVNRLARDEQTTIVGLRTGHCSLRVHLKRIDIIDYALCDCKDAEQTVHYILQDCSLWWQQRHQLWLQDESTSTSCGERLKTCAAPSTSWQRVNWGSKHG